ncbi:MAG: YfiR family protein [Rhizomicrobium sp.]
MRDGVSGTRKLRRFRAEMLGAALCAALMFAGAAPADAAASLEYAVKGTYLYKFLPFVQWPASAFAASNSPITICIVGRDPFGATLDKSVAEQRIDAHPMTIERIPVGGDLSPCRVVFVGIDDPRIEADTVRALEGKPVLTVTDSRAAQPGIIGFVVEQNHVRFDIDDAAAAHDGLVISSKLLGLARAVKPRRAAP